MRILMLINHELTLYSFRQELMIALAGIGHNLIISMPRGEHENHFRRIGCEILHTVISQHGMNPIIDFTLPMRYWQIIKSARPDVVVTYTIKPNIYGGIAARLCGVPCISTVTGLGMAFEKGSIIKYITLMLYRLGMRHTRCVFFQNKAQSELFTQHGIALGQHKIVSGSGVNLRKHCFEPYPDGEIVKLLFVGRITKDKGIDELVAAMRMIHSKSERPISLELLGNIEKGYENAIENWVADRLLVFHGRHDNVHEYMKACHAVVLPSYHEGLANVLLEAAASGRPVIATRIHGCIEAFEDGVTGLGCNIRDAEDLARTIIRFANLTYEQRASMGQKGREKMEREYDKDKVNQAYLEEIADIMIKENTIHENAV